MAIYVSVIQSNNEISYASRTIFSTKKFMSSYQIELQGDVLRVGFNRNHPAHGDRVVRDVLVRLEQMQDVFTGGKLLKIDGQQSIAVAYTIAHQLAHLYGAIAVFDPKIGKPGHKTYIVVISHDPDYKIGDLVETEEPQTKYNSVKVVLCGPPHSGKSCLREGLKYEIKEILTAPSPYVIPACPDGEPAGASEIWERDPQLIAEIKQGCKSDLTPEYAEITAEKIRNTSLPINIIDAGGKLSAENRIIFKQCTHAIILSGDSQDRDHFEHWQEWETFCQEVDLPVIAKIYSDYLGTADRIDTQFPILTGTIHQLSRGKNLKDRPTIKALAQAVLALTYNPEL
jgi:CRISPR-associated protein Csx3